MKMDSPEGETPVGRHNFKEKRKHTIIYLCIYLFIYLFSYLLYVLYVLYIYIYVIWLRAKTP